MVQIFRYNNVTDSFFINIIPVDDELPFLVLNSIKAQEGTRKILSQFELEALDVDTKDKQIIFSVMRGPRHGQLQLKSSDGYTDAKVSKFTTFPKYLFMFSSSFTCSYTNPFNAKPYIIITTRKAPSLLAVAETF